MDTRLKAAGGATALALLLGACGAPEAPGGTTPQDAPTSVPTAPTEPEAPIYEPPAPQPEPADPWAGLIPEEDLEANFLEVVRAEPSSPGIRALDDATLLEYGRSVCPQVEAGGTFSTIAFPGLDPYLEAPIVSGPAVGTWCPDRIESAMGEL